MFQKKTVFVVGAGASKEVGLPIGAELTTSIAQKVGLYWEHGISLMRGDYQIVEALKEHFRQQGGPSYLNAHAEAGRLIASAMPQAISIDNFLHTHSDNEQIVLMGKLGIASCILQAERDSSIFVDWRNNEQLDFSNITDSWHNTFCKMLLENVVKSDIENIFDNVAFISFNYDRCIEHYVSHWLSNYLGMSLQTAQELTKKLTVIHPYGQVGKLTWQATQNGGNSFGASPDWHLLMPVAQQLRTFTERVEDGDPMIEQLRLLLMEAELVVYLGFSFGKMNMDLLSADGEGPLRKAIATSYGMSGPNTTSAKGAILQSMTPSRTLVQSVDLAPLTCNQLLKDYWQQISD